MFYLLSPKMAFSVTLINLFLMAFKAKAKAGEVNNGPSHDSLAHSLWSIYTFLQISNKSDGLSCTLALFFLFLDASMHLYKRVCLSVCPSICPSRVFHKPAKTLVLGR